MRLKRIVAFILAVALVVTALPSEMISRAEGSGSGQTSMTVDASNAGTYLYLNRYKVNSENIGQQSGAREDLKWDNPSLYEKPTGIYTNVASGDWKDTDRWPYIAVKVHVAEDGEYNVSTEVNSPSASTYDTFGMIVDGVTHVLKFTRGSQSTDTETVKLTEGDHIVVFTSPMPEDPAAETGNSTATNNDYPWFDFYSFTFSEGITVSKPTREEVHASVTGATRVEAEDTKYVTWNIYSKTEGNSSASGSTVVGGVPSYGTSQQTFEELQNDGLDKTKTPYLQYMVEAPADGTYYLTIGANVGTSSNASKTNKDNPVPYVAVLVNNSAPVKAQFDGAWGKFDSVTVPVQLKEGVNIIRCTSATKGQYAENSSAWVNLDYFQIQKGLIAKPIVVNAADSDWDSYLYMKKYQDNGTSFGDPNNYADLRYDYPSLYEEMLGIYSDVKPDRAGYWPYIAFTVHAEQAGEYPIFAQIGTRTETKSMGMIVDGAMHVIDVTTTSGELTKSVYLSEGEHVIIFTSPMPRDMESRPTTTGSNTQYAYMDFIHLN